MPSSSYNNSVIVDPTTFAWHDSGWRTPDVSQLIIYELSVHGFTEGDPDIDPTIAESSKASPSESPKATSSDLALPRYR